MTRHKTQLRNRWVCALGLVLCALGLFRARRRSRLPRGLQRSASPGTVSTQTIPQLKDVSFKQRLNEMLPADAAFTDETGRRVASVTISTQARAARFRLLPVPMLCTQVMNGLSSALKVMPFAAGEDYEVVLVSFDPRDTPATAAEKNERTSNTGRRKGRRCGTC